MKKILSLFLTFVFVLALSACSKPAGERVGKTTTQTQAESTISKLATTSDTALTTSFASNDKNLLVTREQAIDIALKEAGVTRDSVYDLEAELDRERNGLFWEVDFEHGKLEYSYDVNAETGAITKVERERD